MIQKALYKPVEGLQTPRGVRLKVKIVMPNRAYTFQPINKYGFVLMKVKQNGVSAVRVGVKSVLLYSF